jgi:tetratricopeptide (TPR) repeat protein
MAHVKRLLAAALLMLTGVAVAYGYSTTRRERTYRQLVDAGEAALARDETAAAIAAFSRAITLKRDSMLGYLKRGEAYRRRNELEAALPDLRRAAQLDPLAPRPLELLGDVNYALGRFTRSVEHYQSCVKLDDRSSRVLYKLGLARYAAGDALAGIDALGEAKRIEDLPETNYLLGLCLRDLQRPGEALQALHRATTLAPAMLQAHEALADLYARLGRGEEQIAQLEALLELDPGPSRAVAFGLALARSGRSETALRRLGLAVEQFPGHPYTFVALGRVWLERAQAGRDRVDLKKAIGALEGAAASEDTSEALTLLGRALLLADDQDAALRVLQRAAGKMPVDPLAFYYLAEAAERRGRSDVARRALLDFQALEGDDADRRRAAALAIRIGDLSLRTGHTAAAVAWYQRGMGTVPGASLLVRLAEAQLASGAPDAARATVARALDKDPAHRAALELRRRLQ